MKYLVVFIIVLSACSIPSADSTLVDPPRDGVTTLPLPPVTQPRDLDNPTPPGWFENLWTPESMDLIVAESFPLQVSIRVVGELPDPCHQAHWTVFDDGATLAIELVAARDPAMACIQVIQPVDFSIDLGAWSEPRTVEVNGETIGSF